MKDETKSLHVSRALPRRSSRFSCSIPLYCYIEGQRFDGFVTNLSLGGGFIVTRDKIPVGATLLVAKGGESPTDGVHLVARVVWTQREPRAGIGVEWIRAATGGDERALLRFVETFLRMPGPPDHARVRVVGGMTVYDLKDGTAPSASESQPEPAPEPAPVAEAVIDAPRQLTRSAAIGPVSEFFLDSESLVEVSIQTTLMVGISHCRAELTGLGATHVTLAGDVVPVDLSRQVKLAVPILTQGGQVEVRLAAYWTQLGAPGLPKLRIASVDDHASPGIYERYLHWMRAQRLKAERA